MSIYMCVCVVYLSDCIACVYFAGVVGLLRLQQQQCYIYFKLIFVTTTNLFINILYG